MKNTIPYKDKIVKKKEGRGISSTLMGIPYEFLHCYTDNTLVQPYWEGDVLVPDSIDSKQNVSIPIRVARCPRCSRYLVVIDYIKQEKIFGHVQDLVHRGKL